MKTAAVRCEQAQATDTIIAMGEARVLPWDELEDDLDTSPMTWPELQVPTLS